jgi:hypothetical protein
VGDVQAAESAADYYYPVSPCGHRFPPEVKASSWLAEAGIGFP